MDGKFKITDNRQISLSRIPSDVHRLGLPQAITKLLIENGVFFINQIDHMTEYDLKQLNGIDSTTATTIKLSRYRKRWNTIQTKTIESLDELKLLIERSARKNDILRITIDELKLPVTAEIAFNIANIKTIGDILQLNRVDILKIKGIGIIRYHEILNSILKVAISINEEINNVENCPPLDPLDHRHYMQPNLTFPEVFTMLLNTTTPRDRAIFFEYFFADRGPYGNYKEIAKKYNLSRERIRQICEKGLRLLRFQACVNCITTYLNTVWKAKVYDFLIESEYRVTKSQLEREFAGDLKEIYLIANKILETNDIWAIILLKAGQHYYLP